MDAKARHLPQSPVSDAHNPIDVLTLGNAIVDVLAHTDEAFLIAQKVHKGAMQLIDEPRAEELTAPWGPPSSCLGVRAPTRPRAWPPSACAPVHRQGQGRRDRPSLRARPQAIDVHYDVAAAAGRPGDGPQLHPGDAGRRAHHEHLSGRVPEPDPGRREPRHGPRGLGRLSRRLSVGSSGRQGGFPQGGEGSHTRPATRSRSRYRTPSASTATATSSWA